MKVVVVGGGSWGTAFSRVLANREHDVTLACRDAEQARAIEENHRNPRYLIHCDLRGVRATTIETAPIEEAELVVVAVPSAVFGDVVRALPGTSPILSLTKGLDPATEERLSKLVVGRPVAILSGPNIADEIARDFPAAAVIASEDEQLALDLQAAITSLTFRVYSSDDVIGVELCAAAKNVIALAAGGADGLALGEGRSRPRGGERLRDRERSPDPQPLWRLLQHKPRRWQRGSQHTGGHHRRRAECRDPPDRGRRQ